jgi:hypothetical protein
MAEKYCDHGIYAKDEQTFTASFASNVMTVTVAPTMRPLSVGTIISGLGIPVGTQIGNLTSGTGGTGTYVLSTSPGTLTARTVTAVSGTVVPLIPDFAWGKPFDGDGIGKTASTASAVASIDLAAHTAPAGATIVIGGAVLTCVASAAGVNQFNAGAGATLVANIVAAINRTTNTVTTAINSPATGWFQNKIQDTVYARVNPGDSTRLDIMTRAGSATYNNNANWRVLSSGLTGAAQIDATFSGGESGCWGWLWMNGSISVQSATMFPSGKSPVTVGVWSDNVSAGVRDAGDVVNCRSNKRLLAVNKNDYFTVITGAMGTKDNPVTMLIDDGTVWPEDGQYPTIDTVFDGGAYAISFGPSQFSYVHFLGQLYPNGAYSVNFYYAAVTGGNWPFQFMCGGPGTIVGVCLDTSTSITGTGQTALVGGNQSNANHKFILKDCKLKSKGSSPYVSINHAGNRVEAINLVIEHGSAAAAHPGILYYQNSNGQVVLEAPKFVGFVPGSQLLLTSTSGSQSQIHVRNADFGGVTLHGPVWALAAGEATAEYARHNTITSQYGQREFMLDTRMGFVEWNPARSFPTLNARLLDGVTPWSILAMPSTITGNLSTNAPLTLPRIGKINTLPDGIRTVRLEFAVEETIVWDMGDVTVLLQYQATDGSFVTEDSYDRFHSPLAVSDAVWSQESNGKVSFVNGGIILHNKYYLAMTTKKAVKTNTEISATVRFHRSVLNLTKTTFVDPELLVS